MIVQETILHPITDIFKILQFEGFLVDLKFLYTCYIKSLNLNSNLCITIYKKKSENQYKQNEY